MCSALNFNTDLCHGVYNDKKIGKKEVELVIIHGTIFENRNNAQGTS
jgi:hypothetical protein